MGRTLFLAYHRLRDRLQHTDLEENPFELHDQVLNEHCSKKSDLWIQTALKSGLCQIFRHLWSSCGWFCKQRMGVQHMSAQHYKIRFSRSDNFSCCYCSIKVWHGNHMWISGSKPVLSSVVWIITSYLLPLWTIWIHSSRQPSAPCHHNEKRRQVSPQHSELCIVLHRKKKIGSVSHLFRMRFFKNCSVCT